MVPAISLVEIDPQDIDLFVIPGADTWGEGHDEVLRLAPIDFARAIFERLEVFPAPVIDAWYGLRTTREPHYYDALVGGGQ